jgi:hypothetical protein
MQEILHEFGFAQTAPTQIYEDNLACVAISEKTLFVGSSFATLISAGILCVIWCQLASLSLTSSYSFDGRGCPYQEFTVSCTYQASRDDVGSCPFLLCCWHFAPCCRGRRIISLALFLL